MNDFRADLHVHSLFSDGTYTPEELIDEAILKNLSALSITDHDIVEGYKRAIPYAKSRNFPLLTGVEFSTIYRKENIHVLCYGFPIESEEIQKLCAMHKLRRKERNEKILSKLKQLHIHIKEEDIQPFVPGGSVGRPHIALALMKKRVVASVKEAFQKYLGDGKRAFEPGEPITLEETLSYIKASGGKAILAHPALIIRKRLLKELLEMPFDGLEGYYCLLTPQEEEPLIKKAKEKGWIITGGSDFHGAIKPNIPLGCSWVDKETFYTLYDSRKTL